MTNVVAASETRMTDGVHAHSVTVISLVHRQLQSEDADLKASVVVDQLLAVMRPLCVGQHGREWRFVGGCQLATSISSCHHGITSGLPIAQYTADYVGVPALPADEFTSTWHFRKHSDDLVRELGRRITVEAGPQLLDVDHMLVFCALRSIQDRLTMRSGATSSVTSSSPSSILPLLRHGIEGSAFITRLHVDMLSFDARHLNTASPPCYQPAALALFHAISRSVTLTTSELSRCE